MPLRAVIAVRSTVAAALAVALLTVVVPQAAAAYKDAILADSPKGYWRLGEAAGSFLDSVVPNGHPGSYQTWGSGPTVGTKFSRGVNPDAVGGDGAILDDAAPSGYPYPNVEGAFVKIPWGTGDHSINFGGQASFSVEAWVRPKAHVCPPPGNGCPWKGGLVGNMRMNQGGNYNVGYGVSVNWPQLTLTFVRAGADGQNDQVTTAEALSTAKWTHVAATYDGATMKIYFDGVLKAYVGSTRSLPTTMPGGPSFLIGKFQIDYGITEYPGAFYGWLDDAAVYDYALDGADLSAHYAAAMLSRYAPELRYDSLESLRADSVSEITDNYTETYTNFLQNSFTIFAASDPNDPADPLSIDYLGVTYPSSIQAESDHYLDEHDETRTEDAQRLNAIPAYGDKAYGRIVAFPNETVLQYWFWYYDNPKTFLSFGEHEGDWEMIQLELSVSETLLAATYSQHNSGEYCTSNDVELNADGHPVVYIAEGSHASYFWAGDHRIIVTGFPDQWDYADGFGESVLPSVIDVTAPPAWMDWPGRFGDTNGVSGASPQGPSQQEKWDDPLTFRDEAASCTTPERRSIDSTVPRRPSAPSIRARRAGGNVVITYEVTPMRGEAEPWVLVATVDGARDRFTPTQGRARLDGASHGTMLVPIGLARGPLRVSASVYAHDGVRSEIVSAQVR
jgi:hypothetical protein